MPLVVVGLVVLVLAGAASAVVATSRSRRLRDELRSLTRRLQPEHAPSLRERSLAGTTAELARAVEASAVRSVESRTLAAVLAETLEAVPLGIVVTGSQGQVLFRNNSALTLVGTGAADALAAKAVSEVMVDASSGRGGSRTLDLHGPPRRTLSLSAVPVGDGTVAAVVEDISERHRLDAVRRDFVANVSHELKTPVAALGLLAETLAGEDDPAVARGLSERVQQEAFRLSGVIDDLLDLSRLEAAGRAGHEPVPVHELLAEAAEKIRPLAISRSVRMAQADVPSSWTVAGDRRQLVSAIANLVENAVKYSEQGASVDLSATTDGSSIELMVQDHGMGIPSRDLDRIFERFYRVDRGRGRDTGGTGLGLSIVRHVASNHGGRVLVESEEGKGSKFTFRVPAQPRPGALVAEAGRASVEW